jgi:2-keto-4-pentenoate hydratase/2-oxohepta-3-ene-1,7-dioic acid hydratase in catechol pathway
LPLAEFQNVGDRNVAVQVRMPALRSAHLQACNAGIPAGGLIWCVSLCTLCPVVKTPRIRFSLNRRLPPTAPDSSPEVKYGNLDGQTILAADGTIHSLSEVRLLPPCWPSKIVCVGRNYREHASELGNPVPIEPLIFLKPPSSLLAHGDSIVHPAISQRVDFEGELALVIGRRATHITPESAFDYIDGYTCLNDVTARDLQKKDGQWTRGKGFDTFCPVGPWIVPKEAVHFESLRVRTFLDGQKRQDAPLTDLIFPIGTVLAFITEFMTLEPGDLIATGTPSGVGPMQRGSRVRVEIEGIGALENPVI